ncbi:MAG TPA: hypothetical protein VLC98_04405 [Phnomibacter sp.]|nr:hypothetical protein [Phnomibacter sp.]
MKLIMTETASIPPPLRIMPVQWVYWAAGSYLLPMAAVIMPAEQLCVNNDCYTLPLWYQYTGQALVGVLACMLLLQMLVWLGRKKWVIWPGVVAGLYVVAFTILKLISLSNPMPAPAGSLAATVHSSISPMWGLYLLLAGGILLLGMHAWLMSKRAD